MLRGLLILGVGGMMYKFRIFGLWKVFLVACKRTYSSGTTLCFAYVEKSIMH